jgi:hypothetical protein
MRSRIIWTMLASGAVRIGVGWMQFRLTALQEPGPLETRIANQAKHLTIRRASSQGIPPRPVDTKPAAKSELHIMAWIATYAMELPAMPKRHRDDGCSHAQRTSRVRKFRAIAIRSCFGLSRTESDSQECRPSARWRQRITFGGLVYYVRTLPITK